MFGGGGFSFLRPARAAVGMYPAARGLVLAHLCAPEDAAGAWTIAEVRVAAAVWTAGGDAARLAALVREELTRAGWSDLPAVLALPDAEGRIQTLELPVALAGEELRRALHWALRVAADEAGTAWPADTMLCCEALPDAWAHRYWTAQIDAARVRALFTAFAAAGISLRYLTFCPPGGGALAEDIAAARAPQMPWETNAPAADDDALPAVYAALLVRRATPAHLRLARGRRLPLYLRRHAAAVIAVAAAAAFLAAVASDAAACVRVMQARDRAEEELALHDADRRRMEEYEALRSDAARRADLCAAFSAASLPWRALLVHLGTMTADGIRLRAVTSEGNAVRIEGEALHYEAVAGLMGRLEEQAFFTGGIALETAAQERGQTGEPMRIRFALRAAW